MQLLRDGKSFSGRERNCVFLNNGDSQYLNISSVSGADFPDDGRALASVDWDHDGDLDLWIHNRTGPRLRFLKNQLNETQRGDANFVALRLQGTTCNRDAIGARAYVVRKPKSKHTPAPTLMKTVYAGDGYLSQSSKWLHFGLGNATEIESIRVRWPNGQHEEFRSVQAGHRYKLVQGSGSAIQLEDRREREPLPPQPQLANEPSPNVRVVFSNPVPLPTLKYYDTPKDQPGSGEAITANERPLLVILWASWCPNCVAELQRITSHREEINSAELDVMALNVDSLTTHTTNPSSSAEDVLGTIKFPFAHKYASSQLMQKLQIMQRVVLNRPLPPAVPMKLLVNSHNELIAIYQGGQPLATILQDVKDSSGSILSRRDLAIPFAGTWTTPPKVLLMRPVANVFRDAGFRDDYERFLKLDRERLVRLQMGVQSEDERREMEVRYANDSLDLALSLLESGRTKESTEYFREGLAYVPDSATGHFHFGRALQAIGSDSEARNEFEKTLQLDPRFFRARFQMAVYEAAAGQLENARENFQRVVDEQPNHAEAWTNLGVVLARLELRERSIAALQTATRLNPNGVQAWMTLGAQFAGQRNFKQASECFRRVTQLEPNLPQGFAALGQALVQLKDDENAAAILQQAVELNPRDAGSQIQLSWLQSTSPISSVRNGKAALQTAAQLAKNTKYRDPRILDVLAAALAETGDFRQAAVTAQRALDLTPPQHPMHAFVRNRMKLYEKGVPYRTKPKNSMATD